MYIGGFPAFTGARREGLPRIAIVVVDGFKHLLLVNGFGLAASGRDLEGRPQSALAASVLTFAGQSETLGRSCGRATLFERLAACGRAVPADVTIGGQLFLTHTEPATPA